MTTPDGSGFHETSPGVALRILRRDAAGGMTFMVRMKAGAHAPLHGHPGGEETYLLEGRLKVCHRVDSGGAALPDVELAPGEYLYAKPGEQHDGFTDTETLFFVVAPGGLAPARKVL